MTLNLDMVFDREPITPSVQSTSGEKADLRMILRRETREQHEEVDRLITAFDLQQVSGYQKFLSANLATLKCLEAKVTDRKMLALYLSNSIERLHNDMNGHCFEYVVLAQDVPHGDRAEFGMQYVLAGAHFGQRVIRGKLDNQMLKTSGLGTSFLDGTEARNLWIEFLNEARSEQSVDFALSAIIDGAQSTFAVFSQSCRQLGARDE